MSDEVLLPCIMGFLKQVRFREAVVQIISCQFGAGC